jgi:hypothetical protein
VTVVQAGAAPTSADTVSGSISQLEGSCPAIRFVVGGRAVQATTGTTFINGACSSLANGRNVTVEGVADTDGTITATSIRRTD